MFSVVNLRLLLTQWYDNISILLYCYVVLISLTMTLLYMPIYGIHCHVAVLTESRVTSYQINSDLATTNRTMN